MGYFGAWASVQFDLEQFLGRLALTAALVLFHSLALTGLRHVLVASPPFQPLDLASLVLLNSALALAGCVARTVSRALPSHDHGRASDL